MADRTLRPVVGSRICVNVSDMESLLCDMGLVDQDDNLIDEVHMHGTVKSQSFSTFNVYLDAAEEAYDLPKKACKLKREDDNPPSYYVVVQAKIVVVNGLVLPRGDIAKFYHLDRKGAETELQEELLEHRVRQRKNSSSTPVAVAAPVAPVDPQPTTRVTATTHLEIPNENLRSILRSCATVAAPVATTTTAPAPATTTSEANLFDSTESSSDDDSTEVCY